MTKEELGQYARENRKRLDAQEVKIGDVVKVLVGQFTGETGIVVGIIACDKSDYTDLYYEIALNCEVPEKYKCRKTLVTPNNVAGGFSAHDFEVIGNRAPKQPSNEIKVGDKVRVSEKTPIEYNPHGEYAPLCVINSVVRCVVNDYAMCEPIWDDGAIQTPFLIPTKYLVKVDAEEKEAKFKVGDKMFYVCSPTIKHKCTVTKVTQNEHSGKNEYNVMFEWGKPGMYLPESDLEPYTEPTEQTEAEKPNHTIKIPVEVDLTDSYWDAYAAELAKEIALKVANKYNDPKETADYAVLAAKAVVERLKRK